jgi:hypothetical protein
MMLPAAQAEAGAIQATPPSPAVPPPPRDTAPAETPRRRPARDDRDDDDDRRDERRDDRRRSDERYDDADYDDDIRREGATRSGTNGMAIAGMVLGIVGFLVVFIPCVGWLLAIILGIVGATLSGIGLGTAGKYGGAGKGMAIAGLVLSVLAIVWVPIWIFIILGSTANAVNQAIQAAKNNPQIVVQDKGFVFNANPVPQGPLTAATAKLTLNNGQATVQNNLADNDPRDRVRAGSACKVFTIDMKAGKTYQIDLVRANDGFDPYLRLEDAAGNNLAQNDDGAGNLNSRIMFTCTAAGEYRIVATALFGTGNFTLQVSER